MSQSSSCPARQDLERYTLGQAAEPEAERLEQHLQRCGSCAATLHELHARDTLTEALRTDTPLLTEVNQPEVTELIARLKENPPPPPDSETYAFMAPPQRSDEIGRLAGYRVLRVLGSGGMGVVFLAEDEQLQRRVALKVVRPALADSAAARERLRREAQAVAALKHPHVIAIHRVGEEHGVLFLDLELLEGESLAERLRRQPKLSLLEVLRIGQEIAAGLTAAHERGLIHRDVKPSNIWLEAPEGHVKILDFGLARHEGGAALTQTDHVIGTPAYMAPEQARGERGDQRSDLFGLGVVLYELCTGRQPFTGDNTLAILEAIKSHQPPPPCRLEPALPAALSDLVMKLLHKAPAARPLTARDVATALQGIERTPVRRPGVRWLVGVGLVLGLATAAAAGPALVELAGQVVRIIANKGVLVIETGDSPVLVTIKGEPVRVVDPATQRTFELAAGDGEVEVKELPDGVRGFTRRFTLPRGGKEVINVCQELAARQGEPAPPAGPFVFRATGAMRMDHGSLFTLTVLQDGRVLAAGGNPWNQDTIRGAEIYDPRSETWTVTGDLNVAREGHRATLLADGRVLVSGGHPRGGELASCEIFDPQTGRWALTDSLATARSGHVAVRLGDGKVLVAGGGSKGDGDTIGLASAELWDPMSEKWTVTGSMNTGRMGAGGAVLADGRVLVAGGQPRGVTFDNLASAEVYDPATGKWQEFGAMGVARRSGFSLTTLPSGQVLVAGGTTDWNTRDTSKAELYDPKIGKWLATTPLPATRNGHTTTLLLDGTVLVAGGEEHPGAGGAGTVLDTAYLFDPVRQTWSATATALREARMGHQAVRLPDGTVLLAGGTRGAASLKTAERYGPG